MLIYLASPIETDIHGHGEIFRDRIIGMTNDPDVVYFNPRRAYSGYVTPTRKQIDSIRAGNRAMISYSDAMFCLVEGVETIREIEHARSRDIPVFAFGGNYSSFGVVDLTKFDEVSHDNIAAAILSLK